MIRQQTQSDKASAHVRILTASKKMFAAEGYENTSTSSIARAAQTSESQIIKHFGSKEGLLEAIFEDGWKKIGEDFRALDYLSSPSAKIQALVGLILTRLEEDDQLQQLFLLEGRRVRKEGHMVLMTQGFRELVNVLDKLLGDMKALGQLRPDLDVQAIRSGLIGMVEGLLRDKMIAAKANYPAAYNMEAIRKLFLHVFQSFSNPQQKAISSSKA